MISKMIEIDFFQHYTIKQLLLTNNIFFQILVVFWQIYFQFDLYAGRLIREYIRYFDYSNLFHQQFKRNFSAYFQRLVVISEVYL